MRIKRKIVYLCENKKVREIIFASYYGTYRPNLKAEKNGPKSKVTVPLMQKKQKNSNYFCLFYGILAKCCNNLIFATFQHSTLEQPHHPLPPILSLSPSVSLTTMDTTLS